MSMYEIALGYVQSGISVIPVKADGSKSPAVTGWRKYTTELADDETLKKWFSDPKNNYGIGAVPGPASGNLIVLDFENNGESAYFEWMQRLPDEFRTIANSTTTVRTPSGGMHVWIKLSESQPGGKLARYANGKTKIEIRGEGHQVLAPGCPAECHSSGKLYEWHIQVEPAEMDATVWLEFLEYCVKCNEYQAPEQPRDIGNTGQPAQEGMPGYDFNLRGTWADTGLFDAGWTWVSNTGDDRGFITRPGKDSGVSASVGQVTSKQHGWPFLFVWTTSTDFPTETPMSRFHVYAMLKHNGNHSEAAKELGRLGYGERIDKRAVLDLSGFTMKDQNGNTITPFAKPYTKPDESKIEDKGFKWMSELSALPDDTKWLWNGYIPRGKIVLFSALMKCGKTTILSHLLKAFDGSRTEFLGQEITPSRVLYLSEEDEDNWAERRDSLLIGDHVGMVCRPFRRRPSVPEWRDYLIAKAETVRKHQFDLVIIDTLSKMWPVREENNAGEVEEALLPFWNVVDAGATVMMVHHMRKSGGTQMEGARGSGGLAAFPDMLLEFTRSEGDIKDRKRIINAVGRYKGIPDRKLIELNSAWQYVCLGDPDDPGLRSEIGDQWWKGAVIAVLRACGEWMTFAAIEETVRAIHDKFARKVDVVAYLGMKFDNGEVERAGEGNKGSPFLYRIVPD